MTTSMIAPFTNRTYRVTSGTNYTSDVNGLITGVQTLQDVTDLQAAGCSVLTPVPQDLIAKLVGANFNVTTDQILTPLVSSKARVRRITVLNTSVPGMSTAAGGFYTAASKGGTTIVANTQVYTGLTNANTCLDLTLAVSNLALVEPWNLYFSLTTAQGAPATADIYVYGDAYPAT